MILFSSDIDWAPEEVIADMLSIFEYYQVKCTLFTTHYSEVILKGNRKLFEIAIHPNFNPLLEGKGGSVEEILNSLLNMYPEARGVRSHCMTQSSTLLAIFARKGLIYDANHFLPYQKGIHPFRLWTGMVRIPYNWEDDIHFEYGKSFTESGIDLLNEGLQIFDFHPVHVFINTESAARYQQAKPYYQQPAQLFAHRNRNVAGTRDLLIATLETIRNQNLPTYKHIEVASQFVDHP